ncbi:hypothetical protein CLOM_g23061 [Closterium sp. NIES-68]|nr:hypothetical protein CLOM_g23061 [Closterium sp. NIES-68]GJP73291.1 hypothetical protein CLOP_g4027 [Closterium sp. NIES-67]
MALLRLRIEPGALAFSFEPGKELRTRVKIYNDYSKDVLLTIRPGTVRKYDIKEGNRIVVGEGSSFLLTVSCAPLSSMPFWPDAFLLACYMPADKFTRHLTLHSMSFLSPSRTRSPRA